ncbi:hypothetical protein [Kutzneria sp. NPDC051319]|uniref:hypothetical protein n=1 Tax=Kutzneria sp. NPDC051319 TaxID=3155047 RepID=UPI00343E2986
MSTPRMTGPEHFREAERLIHAAQATPGRYGEAPYSDNADRMLTAADVHATLALAAATALHALTQYTGMGMVPRSQAQQWQPIVSPEPGTAGEQS